MIVQPVYVLNIGLGIRPEVGRGEDVLLSPESPYHTYFSPADIDPTPRNEIGKKRIKTYLELVEKTMRALFTSPAPC